MGATPVLDQINLVVRDINRSLEFYRRLGVPFGEQADLHAGMTFPNGMRFDLDQQEFAALWNSGAPAVAAGSAVLILSVPTRDDVDEVWQGMVDAGAPARQRPYDTFWGCRFAIIDDPDGYQVGLMSPSDPDRRFWPPTDAPG